jgi:hypothetical protein
LGNCLKVGIKVFYPFYFINLDRFLFDKFFIVKDQAKGGDGNLFDKFFIVKDQAKGGDGNLFDKISL